MTRPDNDPNGSTRLGRDTPPTGTATGADVTSRMAGTDGRHAGSHASHDDAPGTPPGPDHDRVSSTDRDQVAEERYEERIKPARYKSAKTSAAAVFALVFGLAALFCALTGILAPAAVLFGLIGLVLAVAGLKMSKRTGVTGKGVALGGLVTALLGLLLGGAVLAGAAVVVNDEQRLDQLQGWIDDARANLPSGSDVVESVPGN